MDFNNCNLGVTKRILHPSGKTNFPTYFLIHFTYLTSESCIIVSNYSFGYEFLYLILHHSGLGSFKIDSSTIGLPLILYFILFDFYVFHQSITHGDTHTHVRSVYENLCVV